MQRLLARHLAGLPGGAALTGPTLRQPVGRIAIAPSGIVQLNGPTSAFCTAAGAVCGRVAVDYAPLDTRLIIDSNIMNPRLPGMIILNSSEQSKSAK